MALANCTTIPTTNMTGLYLFGNQVVIELLKSMDHFYTWRQDFHQSMSASFKSVFLSFHDGCMLLSIHELHLWPCLDTSMAMPCVIYSWSKCMTMSWHLHRFIHLWYTHAHHTLPLQFQLISRNCIIFFNKVKISGIYDKGIVVHQGHL